MRTDIQAVCHLLAGWDDLLILTHQKPDGDTYGSGFALLWALEALGKRARVACADGYVERYRFIFGDYAPVAFPPARVVSVDVANPELLGDLEPLWGDKIDLCLDHHRANNVPAAHKLVDAAFPATCQLIYHVIKGLGVPFTPRMATAVFTGLSTDTGCFMFSNVDADTHRIAAEMIDAGAEHALVNKIMFDSKSKGRMEIDRLVLDTLEYYFDDRCALITIPSTAVEQAGISEAELDGVSSMPRRIEGVLAGVTLREREGAYKVSLRTCGGLDAAAICQVFGGGGHKNAAGCTIPGDLAQVRGALLPQIQQALAALPKEGPCL